MHFGIKAGGYLILKEKCLINASEELSDTQSNKSHGSYVNIRVEIGHIGCLIDQL